MTSLSETETPPRDIVNALLIHKGTVLLARRAVHRGTYPGLWSFPGGHVEQGETLEAALIREVREEIGVSPIEFTYLEIIPDPNTAGDDRIDYHMYVVTVWEGGTPSMIGDEHMQMKWFTFRDAIALPDLALEEYRPLFRKLDVA